eukprot:7776483-Alexandrium_andersonii.AAC.1
MLPPITGLTGRLPRISPFASSWSMVNAQMAALPAGVVPIVMGDYNSRISRCEPWVGGASSKITDACGARARGFMR